MYDFFYFVLWIPYILIKSILTYINTTRKHTWKMSIAFWPKFHKQNNQVTQK